MSPLCSGLQSRVRFSEAGLLPSTNTSNRFLSSSSFSLPEFNGIKRSVKFSAGSYSSKSDTKKLGLRWRDSAIRCTSQEPISKEKPSMKIAITGATGFVGKRLVETLLAEGHSVSVISRSASKAKSIFPTTENGRLKIFEMDNLSKALSDCNGVVNLAGSPISTRWSPEIKQDIMDSRLNITNKIVEELKKLPEEKRPSVFVSFSAIGFYGASEIKTFDEESSPGSDFLSKICIEWESSAKKIETEKDIRLVIIRTGIVLDKDGGALAKMLPVFQVFAGGPLGTGRQRFSWIHRDDLVRLVVEALSNDSYRGVINGTSPNPVRLGEMCERLGNVLSRPSWLPVPEFALKTILGEGACVVLDGQKVLPNRAKQLGFDFKYPDIADALRNIFAN